MQQSSSLPFGRPCLRTYDDAQASSFVDLSGVVEESRISRPNDIVRLIVGESGAGKTRMLLEHPFAGPACESGIVDIAQHPETHCILDVQAALRVGGGNAIEYWQMYWNVATLRSVATHLLYSRHWQGAVSDADRPRLLQLVNRFVNTEVPVSVTASLSHICRQHVTRNEFKEFYGSEILEFAKVAIQRSMADQTPFCIVLDVSDEVLDNAPEAWSKCLQGLMFFVLDKTGDSVFEQVNIVATLPARVYRAAMEQPRAVNRYSLRAEILQLRWTTKDALHFLNRKISQLPSTYLTRAGAENAGDATAWLGVKTVNNRQRSVRERLEAYILRHTRLTPRHVIAIGNSLSIHSRKAHEKGQKRVSPETIKQVVHESVQDFAQEMFMQCACEIVLQGHAHDYRRCGPDVYEGTNEDVAGNVRLLEAAFTGLASETFTSEQLKSEIRKAFSINDQGAEQLFRLLWNKRFFGVLLSSGSRRTKRTKFADELFDRNETLRPKTPLWLHSLVTDHVPIRVQSGFIPNP